MKKGNSEGADAVSVETAARRLGIGTTMAYRLIAEDKFPVRVIRLGRRIVVPVAELDRLLGVVPEVLP